MYRGGLFVYFSITPVRSPPGRWGASLSPPQHGSRIRDGAARRAKGYWKVAPVQLLAFFPPMRCVPWKGGQRMGGGAYQSDFQYAWSMA